MMYVAVALKEKDDIKAIIRGSLPVTAVDRALTDIYAKIVWAGAIVAVLVAVVTLWYHEK